MLFVVSVSSRKFKKIGIVVAAVMLVMGVVTIYSCFSDTNNSINKSTATNNVVEGTSGILGFISSFGWEVINEPDDVREVIIPVEFDDVYKNYNEIQISQGYDLEKYAGERVKKWSFTITNYPEYEECDYIKINILVFEGKVIGGDVCSVKLDGFMHGFALEKG
ncbi:MAG: DUF4830 domain-containing protein [Ruminococcaceae bacterium]|nr:DUF4830 domain-containing protein [Oscillospiraceae bacterium]